MALGNTGQPLVVVDEKARFETSIVHRPPTAIDSHDPTRPRTWRAYSRTAELSDIFLGGLDELQVLYDWVVVVVERRGSQRKQWRASARPPLVSTFGRLFSHFDWTSVLRLALKRVFRPYSLSTITPTVYLHQIPPELCLEIL